jgi:hypothetical protein
MMWSIFLLDLMGTSISNVSSCGGVLRSVRYVILKEKSSSIFCRGITLIDDNMTNKHRLLCWLPVPVTDRR